MSESTSVMPVHDSDFYWDTVVFRVENRLFKVFRRHFMQSDVFSTTFTLPSGSGNVEGSSDENPFVLHGIMADDFHAFLKVMTQLASNPLLMTRKEWTSALKLSTMWEFGGIRRQAIENISKLNLQPVDQIMLGKHYGVTTWLEQGYRALIMNNDPITKDIEDHGRLLGWETVARMLRIRDHFAQRRCHGCSICNAPQYQATVDAYDAEIQREFRSDFLDQNDASA